MKKILSLALAALLFAQLNVHAEEMAPDASVEAEAVDTARTSHSNSLAHLYNFNVFAAVTDIFAGQSIPFNGTPVLSGAISQTSLDTFSIRRSGHYYVNVVADVNIVGAGATGPALILEVNGVLVGPGTPTTFGDTPVILQQIVPIHVGHHSHHHSTPATLRVLVTGTPGSFLEFPTGPSASISIIQLTNSNNHHHCN